MTVTTRHHLEIAGEGRHPDTAACILGDTPDSGEEARRPPPALETVSATEPATRIRAKTASDLLFVILDGASPLDSPARHRLDGIAAIEICRGKRAVHRCGESLILYLPDARTSGRHARLSRDGEEWWLEDLGSKNGTYLDGSRVSKTLVRDGATIEVGHTFMRFRRHLQCSGEFDLTVEDLADHVPGLITLLPDLQSRCEDLDAVAATDTSVAILGETGTGKDVTARAYHELTGRAGRLVPINCGAVPAGLAEATIFGHRRGAFSGALEDQLGLVREADGGTLFLDEVGDLPSVLQATLLRVIEAREVYPVGASRPVAVDVRIISATHRDIPAMVRSGQFRADLWARLSGHVVHLPPLRERIEDLGLLVAAALRCHAGERAKSIALHRDAVRKLLSHPFPLNTRELFNAIGRALAVADGQVIQPDHLALAPAELTESFGAVGNPVGTHGSAHAAALTRAPTVAASFTPKPPPPIKEIERLLSLYRGNVSEVARALGRSRPLVHRWIRKAGLKTDDFRGR